MLYQVGQYGMVSFLPLDLRKESRYITFVVLYLYAVNLWLIRGLICSVLYCSIQHILSHIDNSIQFGEDADVKIRDFDPEDDWNLSFSIVGASKPLIFCWYFIRLSYLCLKTFSIQIERNLTSYYGIFDDRLGDYIGSKPIWHLCLIIYYIISRFQKNKYKMNKWAIF